MNSASADLKDGGKEWAGLVYIGGTHPAAAGGAYMTAIEGVRQGIRPGRYGENRSRTPGRMEQNEIPYLLPEYPLCSGNRQAGNKHYGRRERTL